jgi:peptidoglycan/LPS O-acetylase OafA/YrhL
LRLNALDGWRGVACVIVAMFHFSAAHSLYFQAWLRYCAPLLEFFFIVSGFVMALAFADSVKDVRGFCAYMIRRLGRVWPLHLVTFGILLCLALAKAALGTTYGGFYGGMAPEAILPQIFMLQTWLGMGLTWNFPAWTLSAEFAAYIAFGLIVLFLRSRGARNWAALAIIAVASVIFYFELLQPREDYNVVSVARCFAGFFLGFLLYDLWKRRPINTPLTATILEIAVVIGFIISIQAHFTGAAYFLNYIVFGGLVFVFANDKGLVSRALSIKPLVWLGKVSFSLYMTHAVIRIIYENVFYILERVTDRSYMTWFDNPFGVRVRLMDLGATWQNDLLLLSYVAVVVVTAALVYRFVEDPTRSYSAQIAKRYQKKELKLGDLIAKPAITSARTTTASE